MAERGRTWRDDEVAKLLEVWSEEGIQAQLRGAVRNEVPFRKIAEELQKAGYERTYTQCRDKIKPLKKKDKEIVDRLRRSGVGMESDDEVTVHDFKWFADVHRVMKNRAVTNPKHVVDSATFEPATPSSSRATTEDAESPQSDQELEENLDNSSSDLNISTENTDNSTPTPTNTQMSTAMSDSNKPPPSKSCSERPPPKKKTKKITKIDRAEKASNDVIDRVLKAQAEERERMVEMERERVKWEERALREEKREDAFMGLFSQLVARLGPPSQQQQQMQDRSYGNNYVFFPSNY